MPDAQRESYRRDVDCGNGWKLLQVGTGGRMKHSCGWASKRVPLGNSPVKYQDRLEDAMRGHMRKHPHA